MYKDPFTVVGIVVIVLGPPGIKHTYDVYFYYSILRVYTYDSYYIHMHDYNATYLQYIYYIIIILLSSLYVPYMYSLYI